MTTTTTAHLADLVVLAPRDDRLHVLLLAPPADQDAWSLIGGPKGDREDHLMAAHRHLHSQAGLTVRVLEFVAVHENPMTVSFMVVLPTAPAIAERSPAARWVPLSEALTTLTLVPNHASRLRAAVDKATQDLRDRAVVHDLIRTRRW